MFASVFAFCDWWYCADKCARSVHVTCDGWALACNGDGGPYWCYLKGGVKPESWSPDDRRIKASSAA
jgi:hypothetical protein